MFYDSVIYILRLESHKFYVGTSSNLPRRLKDHFSGRGSTWTKKYKPVEVVDILEKKSLFTEDNVTKELMFKYGISEVRGGTYCQTKLSESDITTLNKEYRGVNNLCFLCGGSHLIYKCRRR